MQNEILSFVGFSRLFEKIPPLDLYLAEILSKEYHENLDHSLPKRYRLELEVVIVPVFFD